MTGHVNIIGCGPGLAEYLTPQAQAAVARSVRVLGPYFLLELFPAAREKSHNISASIAEVMPILLEERKHGDVALLVSGDPGLHSLGMQVARELEAGEYTLIPGISSLQLACARAGVSWSEAKVISLHGLDPNLRRSRVLDGVTSPLAAFLCDNKNTPQEIAAELAGLSCPRTLHVASNVGRMDEENVTGSTAEIAEREFPGRSIVLLLHKKEGAATEGMFYGLGLGPGDPGLVTVKAARIMAAADSIFVPRAEGSAESMALDIAGEYIDPARVKELPFSVSSNDSPPDRTDWAIEIAEKVENGENVAYLTLGDPLTYSTYIYLLSAMQKRLPPEKIRTIPGITSYNAAASLAQVSMGKGNESLCIMPVGKEPLERVAVALDKFSTLALLKIKQQLPGLLELIQQKGLAENCFYISRATLPDEYHTRNLSDLADVPSRGLAMLLIHKEK